MKKIIFALVAAASMNVLAATYITVQDCGGGEGVNECRTITYLDRGASPLEVVKETCIVGNVDNAPCPTVSGVPKWLKKLNGKYPTRPAQDNGSFAGGSN